MQRDGPEQLKLTASRTVAVELYAPSATMCIGVKREDKKCTPYIWRQSQLSETERSGQSEQQRCLEVTNTGGSSGTSCVREFHNSDVGL